MTEDIINEYFVIFSLITHEIMLYLHSKYRNINFENLRIAICRCILLLIIDRELKLAEARGLD